MPENGKAEVISEAGPNPLSSDDKVGGRSAAERGRMTRTNRYPRLLAALVVALATIVLLGLVGRAEAARQRTNGDVAFTSDQTEGRGVRNHTGDSEIFTIRPDGTRLRQLTFNKADDYAPDYSSDEDRITFSSDRDGSSAGTDDVFAMRADGSDQENLTETPDADDSFSVWSPKGRMLAFTSFRDGNFEVYTMRADGSRQRNLTGNPADDSIPAWSPRDNRIAFNTDRDGDYEVFTMRANGSGLANLTEAPASNEIAPEWSPDAGQLSFASDRDGGDFFVLDIFKMGSDGSGQENLTETPGAVETFSTWSPDGRRIAFDSDREDPFSGNEDVFGMRSDGSGQRKLSGTLAADDYAPSWQSGGEDDGNDD